MEKKISLFKHFGKIIITRKAIADFFNELRELSVSEILLDFDKIEFISRSCAHEYIIRKENSGLKIRELSMSPKVLAMFNLIIKQSLKVKPVEALRYE